METVALFAQFVINVAWLAMLVAVIVGVMYAIGKGLQAVALRHRIKESQKHEWAGAADTLTANYHRPPTLAELQRRADREVQLRTARIAENVMAQVSKHHDEYLH